MIMKNLMIVAFAAFALAQMNAQEVKFGVKAGLNLASIGGDETDDVDARTSFHIGGIVEIVITEKFSVQPELLYSAQGAKSKFSESGADFSFSEESTIKLDYINLPIMAKYYLAEGFSIEAGPQIGFLLSAKEDYEFSETFNGTTVSGSEEIDLKDFTNSIDFGIGVGASYKLDSGLNFSARYNLGLSNIYDGEGSDDFKNQNNVLQLSIGYMF